MAQGITAHKSRWEDMTRLLSLGLQTHFHHNMGRPSAFVDKLLSTATVRKFNCFFVNSGDLPDVQGLISTYKLEFSRIPPTENATNKNRRKIVGEICGQLQIHPSSPDLISRNLILEYGERGQVEGGWRGGSLSKNYEISGETQGPSQWHTSKYYYTTILEPCMASKKSTHKFLDGWNRPASDKWGGSFVDYCARDTWYCNSHDECSAIENKRWECPIHEMAGIYIAFSAIQSNCTRNNTRRTSTFAN